MLKEIKPKQYTDEELGFTPSAQSCPSCGGGMVYGPVPCPDGKPGCLVLHYGHTCRNCGKQWA